MGYFNEDPDECELNKFDDVMTFLQHNSDDFCQVIAVDRDFSVFSRIWCIAELCEAYFSCIPQKVVLRSAERLRDDNSGIDLYLRLAALTVADAEATRPEDKKAILSRIDNIPAFDAQLQVIIFGEFG